LLVLWMKMVEIPQQGLTFSSQNKTSYHADEERFVCFAAKAFLAQFCVWSKNKK